ncbi:AMP-binding protein [Changchengzhania lutea]|uniref:AMP-binding protein n=1 Tax=Changchengzhania lutea TaxID=2049305 RepID=UPI00115F5EC3|nr:AMP-binding protein [Changchengzhania lutea]
MIPDFNKVHNRFKLNSIHYSYNDVMEVAYSYVKEGEPFEQGIGNFLLDWLDHKPFIKVNTSGSTGKPKTITLFKQAMANSAIATGDFFKLEPGDSALHCLPSNFIAGKMMLIRAMILGLELDIIAPTMYPQIKPNMHYRFCAMIPMQAQNVFSNLSQIDTLIIGGTSVPKSLIESLQDIPTVAFETYGMTETITHIAARRLNHFEAGQHVGKAPFKVLPNIKISQDRRGCLVIEAPKLLDETLVTNDVVTIHSDEAFDWLGRYDNVINSGGVKLFPEGIETKLQNHIEQRFFVASEKDDLLGNKAILVVEGEKNEIDPAIFSDLDKYEIPKEIYTIRKFVETNSGKIQRAETLKQLAL